MSTLTIQIKSGRAVADLTGKLVKDATARQEAIRALINFLAGVASGAEPASVDVHTASASPVAAAGTITIDHDELAADETVTIAGITITAKASGANGTTQFNIGADATADATALKNCINANTTLSKHFIATSALGVVTVTAKVKGELANLIAMSTSDSDAYTLVQLTGGTGGAQGTGTTYSLGL